MDEEKKTDGQPEETALEKPDDGKKSFILLYVAIGCFAAGFILLALAIILPLAHVTNVSVHLIIASMICELAAVSFINGQKRRVENKLCKVFTILSYVVMIIGLAIVIVGTSLNSTAN